MREEKLFLGAWQLLALGRGLHRMRKD